jgi:sugar phosphate permease
VSLVGASPPAVGLRSWMMWAVPTAVFLIAFFHRPAPGLIAKELMQTFEASGTMVGLLSATYFYSYAGLMIPAGVCLDAFGTRRVISAGSALMGAGAIAMAVAAGQPMLFAGRFVVGMGATVTFVGALKVAATWFPPSYFGTLSALTATAGVLGGLTATTPLAWLVAGLGWRGAFVVVGVATLAGAALSYAVVRDHPHPERASAPSLGAVVRGMVEVLRNVHTWPPFLAFFFLYASTGNAMLWVIPYLRDVYGLSRTDAATCAAATPVAMLVGAPLTGWIADRVVQRRRVPFVVLTACLFATWLVFLATLGTLSLTGVTVVLFVMGAVGGAFVLVWPVGRDVNPPRLAGVAVAVVNLGGFLGAAVTQGPLGAVLDARWQGALADGARVYPLDAYRAAFGICAAFVLASAVIALFMRETRGRNVFAESRRGREVAV